MVVLGDVFAVISIFFGVCLSAWALTIGLAVLFQRRSAIAEGLVEQKPWKAFGIGLLMMVVGGGLSQVLLAMPLPGPKLLGFIGWMVLLTLSFLGMGGLSLLVARRIQPLEPNLSSFRALGRGAGILVIASLLPLIGWFVFAPIVMTISMGAGLLALFARGASPAPAFEGAA